MEESKLAIGDIIVGIDIGTSKVATVVGEVNNFNQIEINFEIFERELLEGSFAKEEKDDRIIESDNDEA